MEVCPVSHFHGMPAHAFDVPAWAWRLALSMSDRGACLLFSWRDLEAFLSGPWKCVYTLVVLLIGSKLFMLPQAILIKAKAYNINVRVFLKAGG